MSATLEHQTGNIYQLRVTGVLKKSDLDAVHAEFANTLADAGPIQILIMLEKFNGWEQGAEWDDGGFFYEHGDSMERIAVVGDARWEVETLAFTGAGLRKAPVKFFAKEDQAAARAWLAE